MPRRKLKMTKKAIASRRSYRKRKSRGGALFGNVSRTSTYQRKRRSMRHQELTFAAFKKALVKAGKKGKSD